MAYSELIKNFEKIREYMRQFYVYGFKSRSEYSEKSARSYDDEKRRIESWLGDHMRFERSAEGKNVFLSVDSRVIRSNPFYRAWKTKSFTDGDITLHFLLFDILHSAETRLTLAEILDEIGYYLEKFEHPLEFDESTVRKKLKEYVGDGIIISEKEGKRVYYRRSPDTDISGLFDMISFFSEVMPCGVIGSFVLDKLEPSPFIFGFKHHYINSAFDSGVLVELFSAMEKKCYITAEYHAKRRAESAHLSIRILPLKILISAQNGRQYLLGYRENTSRISTYRLDHLSDIKLCEISPHFDSLRQILLCIEPHMWGVNCHFDLSLLKHMEFEVEADEKEDYIVNRLEREKRCGRVEKLDERHYRYSADVFDESELIPWIRTFITRITKISFDDKRLEESFRQDIYEMYRMYGIGGESS